LRGEGGVQESFLGHEDGVGGVYFQRFDPFEGVFGLFVFESELLLLNSPQIMVLLYPTHPLPHGSPLDLPHHIGSLLSLTLTPHIYVCPYPCPLSTLTTVHKIPVQILGHKSLEMGLHDLVDPVVLLLGDHGVLFLQQDFDSFARFHGF